MEEEEGIEGGGRGAGGGGPIVADFVQDGGDAGGGEGWGGVHGNRFPF